MTKLAYTIHEACEVSSLGRTKIYDAINEGLLVPRKFGKRTLILHDELVRFLEALPTTDGTQTK